MAAPINRSRVPKVSSAPLLISFGLLMLNFMIGDTIFANVIVLFFSFVLAVVSFSFAVIAFLQGNREAGPFGIMIGSIVIMGIIITMFATNNVAMGYGP